MAPIASYGLAAVSNICGMIARRPVAIHEMRFATIAAAPHRAVWGKGCRSN